MTRVLHTYSDVRVEDQLETATEMVKIGVHYPVKWQYCIEDDDYWAFLLRNWGYEDIVIVEQDVVAKRHLVDGLVECPEHVCTYPYRLKAGQLSVFEITDGDTIPFIPQFYEVTPPLYTDGSGLGFIKISKELQKHIPLHTYDVGLYKWWYLDSFISWHLKRLKYKIHVHQHMVQHNRSIEDA